MVTCLVQRLQVALPAGDRQISTSLPPLGPGFHSLTLADAEEAMVLEDHT